MSKQLFPLISIICLLIVPDFSIASCPETSKNEGCKIPGVSTPSDSIKNFRKLVEKNISGNMSPAAKNIFKTLMKKYFDFNLMAQASMGAEWKNFSTSEQSEFSVLFTQMIQNSYLKKLIKHTSFSVIMGKEKSNKTKARVKTSLVKKKGKSTPIEVEYRLHNGSGSWKIYDVITDEVSLVKNYRSSFISIYKKGGFNGLKKHLQNNAK
ncbi:MAG: ABC transporter substrate-binding protein [Deltaproteobacteria bacterium]|nr:ABC transporter substrate-binding protein [Deltaproteobacteria bacterium]